MSWTEVILALFFAFFGLPVLSYMVMKFGAAGFYRAKRREQQQQQQTTSKLCQDPKD